MACLKFALNKTIPLFYDVGELALHCCVMNRAETGLEF